MNDALIILLAWAAHLSGYPRAELPKIQFEDHAFFIEHVCGGKDCNAIGWYNDEGIIYISERHQNLEDGFTSSLIVHEMTHYLQHKNGITSSCFRRELEAYAVQNRYIQEVLTTIYQVVFRPC